MRKQASLNATPGPWHREGLSIYGPKHPDSRHKNGRIYIGAVVVGTNRADPQLDGGAERFEFDATADAKLIAAAPDLLEACKAMISELEDRCLSLGWESVEAFHGAHKNTDGWYGQARVAIAKAESR